MRILKALVFVGLSSAAPAAVAGGGVETATARGPSEAEACDRAVGLAKAKASAGEVTRVTCKCTEDPRARSSWSRFACIATAAWEEREGGSSPYYPE
jgi:hypothetical protein